MKRIETFSLLVTVLAVGVSVSFPFAYEHARLAQSNSEVDVVIELTGVARPGVWTTETINAVNYWRGTAKPARPVLRVGETVLFRLRSADDTHSFYVPELGIGPLEVYPGKVVEVRYTADRPGRFLYLCTVQCGVCHFWMKGEIVVLAEGEEAPPPAEPSLQDNPGELCPHLLGSPAQDIDFSLRGRILFETIGCITCHGPQGQGGIENIGYVKETVPQLNILAEKMMLFEKEDVEAVIDLLERRIPLASVADDPPVARFNVVLAQYDSIRETIRKGSEAGKAEPDSPLPPYHMPRWADRLSDDDIDALLVYLLKQYPWEEEDWEEEEK